MKVVSIKMKECCIALFLLLGLNITKSQVINIKDSIDNTSIKHVELHINNNIFYTDSLGKFNLNNAEIKGDIVLKKWGYKEKKIDMKKFQSNILLSPIFKDIEEVTIEKKNVIEYKKNIKKNNTTQFPKGIEITSFIENTERKEGKIHYVKIPLKSVIENNGFIIINFYKKENNGYPSVISLNKTPIIIPINSISKKDNKIYLSDEEIILPTNGVFIGVRITSNVGIYEPKISLPIISFYNSKDENILFRIKSTNTWKAFGNKIPSIGFTIGISR